MSVIPAQSLPLAEAASAEAWSQVVGVEREAGQRLFGYAVHMGVDRARAADLVQDALLRLWHELERGTAIDSPEAWTFRTLSRMVIDEHRLIRRSSRLLARLSDRMAPRVTDLDSSVHVAVWAQVDRLPERQRQVVYLRYRADLSFEEVAQVMGITASATRSHATQAMHTLRSALGDQGNDDDG